jgi:hypothetical protein
MEYNFICNKGQSNEIEVVASKGNKNIQKVGINCKKCNNNFVETIINNK